MAVEIGTATGYNDLLKRFREFITGRGKVLSRPYTGTGNGVLSGLLFKPAAVTEVWTITCTAGGPTGIFSVVGSVSGAAASLTVGVAYSNSMIENMLVSDGSTDFIIGDKWIISVAAGAMSVAGQAWHEERWAPAYPDIGDASADDFALYIRGPGLAGTDAIHIQLSSYHNDVSDYYNLRINGAAGYDAAAVPMYYGQPGHDGGDIAALMLWDQTTPYWFIANGRRFIIIAKISTVYQTCYGGFILPYGLPSEFPYPLVIGGSFLGKTRWSNSSASHFNFTNPNQTLKLRQPDGNWQVFQNYVDYGGTLPSRQTDHNVYPTAEMTKPRPSPDGTYTLNPLVLHSNSQGGNVYGELQGVHRVSGYANASENMLNVASVDRLVVQDGFRTGVDNYFTITLE